MCTNEAGWSVRRRGGGLLFYLLDDIADNGARTPYGPVCRALILVRWVDWDGCPSHKISMGKEAEEVHRGRDRSLDCIEQSSSGSDASGTALIGAGGRATLSCR